MEDFEEVKNFVEEENVKFLKLVYFDAFGNQKCVSIMPQELDRAFRYGVSFDAGAVPGFGSMVKSDLFLKPDPNTLSIVPWRPLDGRVARMFCNVSKPDGTPFERDTRYLLRQAVKEAKKEGISVRFGPEMEFYVFRRTRARTSAATSALPCSTWALRRRPRTTSPAPARMRLTSATAMR